MLPLSSKQSSSEEAYHQQFYHEAKAKARALHDTFKEAGIPDEIYYDSMSDIEVWAENYYRKHGKWGLSEIDWINKVLSMKVFKLGRLQFEPLAGEPSHEILHLARCPAPGTLVLNTHIQAGASLDPLACQASYAMAGPFFLSRGLNFSRILFYCDSWLLHPLLIAILPSSSNIIKFQKPYTIVSTNPNSRHMELRVFGELRDRPEDYPEQSSLQRALKKALTEGMPAGTAKGYFVQAMPSSS